MIEYVPYRKVDKKKYDHCLTLSSQFRVYAQSWYLDAVCEQWDLIVYNDYAAVMPLPHRVKFGLKYIFTPAWVQQLGIFSAVEIEEKVKMEMMRRIPNSFFLVDYTTNYLNPETNGSPLIRKNYVLRLEDDLKSISKGFKKNRKSAFNQDFSRFWLQKSGDPVQLMELFDKVVTGEKGHRDSREKLLNLLHSGSSSLHLWLAYRQEVPVGGMVWLEDHRRLTYLYSAVLPEHRKDNLSTFMLRKLMEAYENSGLILDFEGSMHPGIEFFFRSFGAEKEHYYHLKRKFYGLFG